MPDANTLPERQSSNALISPPTIVVSPSATALDEAGLQSQRLISDDDNVSVVTTEKSDDEGAFVTLHCLTPQTQAIRLLLLRPSDLKVIGIHNQCVGDVSCVLNQQDMDELCSYGLRPNECIVCVCFTVFGLISRPFSRFQQLEVLRFPYFSGCFYFPYCSHGQAVPVFSRPSQGGRHYAG